MYGTIPMGTTFKGFFHGSHFAGNWRKLSVPDDLDFPLVVIGGFYDRIEGESGSAKLYSSRTNVCASCHYIKPILGAAVPRGVGLPCGGL